MKFCNRCKTPHERKHRYCLSCHAMYMREWRRTHYLTLEQKKKRNTRSYANTYLKRGKLFKQPCEVCGGNAQIHHPDYTKPLEIKWLCRRHHLDLHIAKRAAENVSRATYRL